MGNEARVPEGGCLCRAVRYRAEGPVTHRTLCHCETCRKAAGAPCVAWVTFERAGFSFTAGAPAEYRSSEQVVRTFCGRCGTSLTYRHAQFPDEIDVTTCSLDAPEAFAPADHTWTSERLAWLEVNEHLPAFAEGRDG